MLDFRDSKEEDLKSVIWKTTSNDLNFFFNIISSWVIKELHTKNQLHSMLNFRDSKEEDRKSVIWKTTSNIFIFFFNIISSYVIVKLHTKFQLSSLLFWYFPGWE